MGDVWAWLLFFFIVVALLVMLVFQLMCLADLEFDYINPYDSASRIKLSCFTRIRHTRSFVCPLSHNRTLGYVISLSSIPLLQYAIVSLKATFSRCNRDLLARLGKEATAFQAWLHNTSSLHVSVLDDLQCIRR